MHAHTSVGAAARSAVRLVTVCMVMALSCGFVLAGSASAQDAAGHGRGRAKAPRFTVTGTESFDQYARTIKVSAKVGRVKPGTNVTFERYEVTSASQASWVVRATRALPADRRVTATVPVNERQDAWYRVCSVSRRGVAGCSATFESKAYIAPDPVGDEPRQALTPEAEAQWIQEALDKVNARRADVGVAPLALDTEQAAAAREKARYLYETAEFPPPGLGFTCSGTFLNNYEPQIVAHPEDQNPAYTKIAIGVYWTEAVRDDDVYFAVVSILS